MDKVCVPGNGSMGDLEKLRLGAAARSCPASVCVYKSGSAEVWRGGLCLAWHVSVGSLVMDAIAGS